MPDPALPAPSRHARPLFVLTILTGSFLLFLVQPMVARLALPRIGGAPAVWNSAMLVYQALLLGGYAYAHWLSGLAPRRAAAVHLAVLVVAALWLPIRLFGMTLPADAEPALWVPWLLAVSIGPLFLAVAAGAPMVQRWYTTASGGADPYPLYAASNLGSFAGLLAYPLLLEPLLPLSAQRWAWSVGYGLLVLLFGALALRLPRTAGEKRVAPTSPAPTRGRVLMWTWLALVPSGLILATTIFITTDIVAVPLIWVLPLGLYLLSFTIAFAERRWLADLIVQIAPITLLLFGGTVLVGRDEYPILAAGMALVLLFMVAVALHSRLHALRPEPDRLTGFYLVMSAGGALGGVLGAIVAPVLFDWTWEYPLLVLAAGLLLPMRYPLPVLERVWTGRRGRTLTLLTAVIVLLMLDLGAINPGSLLNPGDERILFLVVAAIGLLAIGKRPAYVIALAGAIMLFGGYRALTLTMEPGARTRSYFGVYTIRDTRNMRILSHGTTIHGVQMLDGDRRRPTTYYGPTSGVGRAMQAAPALYGPDARIGVVGLGAGTLACYAKPGQDWRFYEIDPAVVRIARDGGKFTFLRDCLPKVPIVMGDARLRLAEAKPASLDLLVLDAFSSDAVPMHLMTTDAFAVFARALPRNGLLMAHVSNRFLRLEPVVRAVADAGGWQALILDEPTNSASDLEQSGSSWIALSRDPATMAALKAADARWASVPRDKRVEAWTDDRAALLPVLRVLDRFR